MIGPRAAIDVVAIVVAACCVPLAWLAMPFILLTGGYAAAGGGAALALSIAVILWRVRRRRSSATVPAIDGLGTTRGDVVYSHIEDNWYITFVW